MFGKAFDNPDDLAILIYHETSHWVDVAAKTGGGRPSDLPFVTFQSEADAYARSAKIAKQLGRDPTQMEGLAARYAQQAKESGGRSWEWVLINKRNWLGTDRRELATVPTDTEAASDDETVLHQKMAELQRQVKENKEYMERREKERREEDERNREQVRQYEEEVRRAREAAEAAKWQERDAAAAACGYTPRFQGNTGKFLWYEAQNALGFLRQPTSTSLTTNQYRIAFLINRACYGAAHDSERNPPRACNDAAGLIHSFAAESDGAAKLDAMFGPDRGDRRCLYHIINQSSGITDSASFNKVIAKYQKQLEKERRENDKRWHSGPPRSDDGKPERGRPPPADDDGCDIIDGIRRCPR